MHSPFTVTPPQRSTTTSPLPLPPAVRLAVVVAEDFHTQSGCVGRDPGWHSPYGSQPLIGSLPARTGRGCRRPPGRSGPRSRSVGRADCTSGGARGPQPGPLACIYLATSIAVREAKRQSTQKGRIRSAGRIARLGWSNTISSSRFPNTELPSGKRHNLQPIVAIHVPCFVHCIDIDN